MVGLFVPGVCVLSKRWRENEARKKCKVEVDVRRELNMMQGRCCTTWIAACAKREVREGALNARAVIVDFDALVRSND